MGRINERKIYAVSSGEYSDYSVHAIFETEEDAKYAATLLNSHNTSYIHDAEVQEMPFYAAGELPQVITYYVISEKWYDDRTDSDYEEAEYHDVEFYSSWRHVPGKRPTVRWNRRQWGGSAGVIEISARDLDVARKVWSDRKAQWKANDPIFDLSMEMEEEQ